MRQRQRLDPKHVLNQRIRGLINVSLRVERSKKGRHWEDLVGYMTEQLMERLVSTMPLGYTWRDFMEGRLHVDHKIPVSVFNFSKPEHIDFKRCWALSNLQLLPQLENLKKGNKLLESFQPALALEIND